LLDKVGGCFIYQWQDKSMQIIGSKVLMRLTVNAVDGFDAEILPMLPII
jgi:hypothetical protein